MPFLSEGLLKNLDYQGIVKINPALPLSSADRYAQVRAEIVLGNYEKARLALARVTDAFSLSFLKLQLEIFEKKNYLRAANELAALEKNPPQNIYLQAELYFILGYVCNLQDAYQAGAKYHQRSAELYLVAELPAAAAIAYFNLCVAFNHVNKPALFKTAFDSLESLAQKTSSSAPAVRLAFLRMRAYKLVDHEQYELAMHDLSEVLSISRAQNRQRDQSAVISLMSYLVLKLDKWSELPVLKQHLASIRSESTAAYGLVLQEFHAIAEIGIANASIAKRLIQRWKEQSIDSVWQLFLYDLLLAKIQQSQDYELLESTARLARSVSLNFQQALALVDFRHYEACAWLAIGDKGRALKILKMYEHDAREAGALRRLEKSEALKKAAQLPTSEQLSEFIFDLEKQRLSLGQQSTDLSGFPVIANFLKLLAQTDGYLNIDDLFEQLYQQSFDPLMHERRLSSVIDRARKILGSKNSIVRRDGKLGLHPDVSITLVSINENKTLSADLRRQKILQLLRLGSSHGMKIVELEQVLQTGRRTLQMDLLHLAKAHLVRTSGKARSRVYFAGTGA